MDILEQLRIESNSKNKQLLHWTLAEKAAAEIARLREMNANLSWWKDYYQDIAKHYTEEEELEEDEEVAA